MASTSEVTYEVNVRLEHLALLSPLPFLFVLLEALRKLARSGTKHEGLDSLFGNAERGSICLGWLTPAQFVDDAGRFPLAVRCRSTTKVYRVVQAWLDHYDMDTEDGWS
jgi:hypothetical protein